MVFVFLGVAVIIIVIVAIRLDRWHARRYWRRKAQEGEGGVCLHSTGGLLHVRVRLTERL